MIGGIIGDLAASTYLRDKDVFYKCLFDDKATLSEYGLSVINSNNILFENDKSGHRLSHLDAKVLFDKFFKECSLYNGYTPQSYLGNEDGSNTVEQNALLLIRLACSGWYDREELVDSMMFNISFDKEQGYARLFTPEIIKGLRKGLSKDQTYSSLSPIFKSIRHEWNWQNGTSILCLLMRAWNCFYKSFDFGSAIHNAVRDMPENPRLMATLVGIMASAMYGSTFYYIKRKFDKSCFTPCKILTVRTVLEKDFWPYISKIETQESWQREFFKKNEAATNVERHSFTSAKSQFELQSISEETRRRILLSFPTSWENRFGFYLDDGWVYVYRSNYLLGRFRITPADDSFVISHVQQSDELPKNMLTIDQCIQCALKAAVDLGSHIQYHYLYKVNCNSNPYNRSEITKSKFWECEKMFSEQIADTQWCKWIEIARKSISEMEDTRWILKFKEIGADTSAILSYISNLYSKFCPYENQDWMLEF